MTTQNALVTLATTLAERFGMGQDASLVTTLRETCFRSKEQVTDSQLTQLLVVAKEYGLNPFTKEIYAFPGERGIVPIISIDGWIRITNEHPQFDGVEFQATDDAVTCTIYRKDRSKPTVVTEYLVECKRSTDPWNKMPKRMLRHKALIQCARVAFGFAGYDEEEGAVAAGMTIDNDTGEILPPQPRGPQRKSASQAPASTPTAEEVKSQGAAQTSSPPADAITAGQVAYLRNKLKAAQIDEQTICDRFQVTGIELLNAGQFDAIKAELLTTV